MALAGRRFGRGEGDFRAPPLFVVAPHTLVLAAKSSGKASNLVALLPAERSLVVAITRLVPAQVMAATALSLPINAAFTLPDCGPWFSKAACCKQ
jgi:hypothetical protein